MKLAAITLSVEEATLLDSAQYGDFEFIPAVFTSFNNDK